MPTVSILENYERFFVDKIQAAGYSFEESYICILMYFREFTRPLNELPAIISRFSPHLTEEKVHSTFLKLKETGLIEEDSYGELKIYKITENFEKKLEEYTHIENLSYELTEQKSIISLLNGSKSKVNLTPKGGVSLEGNYQSLLTRLRSSRNSIKAAMLCSMANKGVNVQLLIGSTNIAKKIRGKSVKGTYEVWKNRFANINNVEVRQFDSESAAELCSSFLIDDSVLRLVVYDYATMPSLDGYLLEVIQQNNANVNLISWYKTKFDSEWEKSKYSDIPIVIKKIFSLNTLCLIITALLIYIYYKYHINGLAYDILLLILGACISFVCRNFYLFFSSFIKKLFVAIRNL